MQCPCVGKLAQLEPLLVRQALPALAMAEAPHSAEELEAEEQPGSSATSSGDSADPLSEYFVRHKVRLPWDVAGQSWRHGGARPLVAPPAEAGLLATVPTPTRLLLCFMLQLTKLDTLAGLAVKYNVTVGAGACW